MALKDHKMTPGEPYWGTRRYNPALDEIQSLLDGKADAIHSHDATGTIAAAIGTADSRPTGTEGLIHSELEDGQAVRTVVLHEDGQEAYRLISTGEAALIAVILGG